MPLTLAFARTIHTFQGMEAGKDKHIKAIVVDVGTTKFESSHSGVLYTALSRASTLGKNGDINQSSIYFCGLNLKIDRLTNVKYHRNASKRGQEYKIVRLRDKWIQYLKQKATETEIISTTTQNMLKLWAETTTYSKGELDQIIAYHSSTKWDDIRICKPCTT